MDIETMGLGAGSYPTPPEEKTKTINITLNVEYSIRDYEYPEDWSFEQIKEDIREYMDDYIRDSILEDWEVDIDG